MKKIGLKIKLLGIFTIVAFLLTSLVMINPAKVLAASNFRGGTYIVSNTDAPAWADAVSADVNDIVQFKVDIVNLGDETARNVRARATFPTVVAGSSIASTISVVADNAPAMSDTATVNVVTPCPPNTDCRLNLVYFPGHAVLIRNEGQSSIEAIGSGSFVAIGNVLAGESNFVEVTFKAKVTRQEVSTPPPQPSPPPAGGQQQQQQQQQQQTQTVNVTQQAAPQPQLAGVQAQVKELPKTGLPLLAWSALAFLPAGLGLRRFAKGPSKEFSAQYLWEKREFEKVGT